MCGILGAFQTAVEPFSLQELRSMLSTIHHRGPDGQGEYVSSRIALGQARLAIIDLAHGDQPFFSEDRKVALIQNGEIYNYRELKAELQAQGVHVRTNSDTEILLHLYMRDGLDFVQRLVGMFVIAIADERSQELILVRDALGVKPLYFYHQGNQFLFGSEIKAILRAGIPREMDPEAFHHFMTFGYVPSPLTMFKGVRHVEPGCLMRVSTSGVAIQRWWDLSTSVPQTTTMDAFRDEFLARLDQSVAYRMVADVPFGAFLSGGLDSSSVVGMMTRHTDIPIKTFSIGFEDPRFDESEFAAEAAARFGTQHTLEIVGPDVVQDWARVIYHCDQPHSDVSFLPMRRLAQMAVRDVKMVLTGDGGDELFGGYEKYTKFFAQHGVEQSPDEFASTYHHHIALFGEAEKRSLYGPKAQAMTSGMNSEDVTRGWLNQVSHWDRINQALWLDVSMLLPGNNLVKPDRMTMSASLEGRDPFLDKHLTEFAFRVRGDFKIQNGETRFAYKKAVEGLLGDRLTYRQKRMFTVPIGEWFRAILREPTRKILLSESFRDWGLFDPSAVNQVLEDHDAGQDRTRQIRQLVALELWRRVFIEESRLDADVAASKMDVTEYASA
jgi:asparagine synthase (glutamine-hydrolysing)